MAELDVTIRYELERELGRGGMGTVYRARDRTTGELVAIKVLRRRLVRDLLRFSREVGVLAGLEHPGIVRYLGHGELPNGKPALIMEWVEGETLAKRATTRGLTITEAVATITQVAEALAFAHAQGIVHRDIKPDNILFIGDGLEHVKLIDFGIARRVDDVISLTRTGMRIGTPCYMSPEQARGEREVDARADVFMLGCVLYECVGGRRAFAGANMQALLGKIILANPIPIDFDAPESPPELVALIQRMLAKDPAHRPPDAGAVARELAALPIMPPGPLRKLVVDASEGVPGSTAVPTLIERPGAAPDITPDHTTFIMLIVPPDEDDDLDADDDTIENTARENLVRALCDEVSSRGLRVEVLANGSVLGVLSSAASPTQLATRLAECALSLKRWAPDVSVAFLSDRQLPSPARESIGSTLERGFAKLESAALRALTLAQGGETGVVHLDEETARLLQGQFTVVQDDAGFQLVATGNA